MGRSIAQQISTAMVSSYNYSETLSAAYCTLLHTHFTMARNTQATLSCDFAVQQSHYEELPGCAEKLHSCAAVSTHHAYESRKLITIHIHMKILPATLVSMMSTDCSAAVQLLCTHGRFCRMTLLTTKSPLCLRPIPSYHFKQSLDP